MTAVFADTFYFIALLCPEDNAHRLVVEYSNTHRRKIVTTTWVLTELANACAGSKDRRRIPSFLAALKNDLMTTILPTNEELFQQGLDLYGDRLDKTWSLTDCISFVAMRQHQLADALTADKHFLQAGFHPLFSFP